MRVIGKVSQLVDHKEMWAGVEVESATAELRRVTATKIVQQRRGRAKQNAETCGHGGRSDILCDHGFPQSVCAEQNDVAAFAHELQTQGAFDQIAIDFLWPVPVEVGDRFEAADPGGTKQALSLARAAAGSLDANDLLDQGERSESKSGGASDQVIETFSSGAQAEAVKPCGQVIRWNHRWMRRGVRKAHHKPPGDGLGPRDRPDVDAGLNLRAGEIAAQRGGGG